MIWLAGNVLLGLNVVDVGSASVAKKSFYDNNDAFFVSPPNFYGVFDGVSACPESREFARMLADTTQDALSRVDSSLRPGEDRVARALSFRRQAQSALQKACQRASFLSGASTALIVQLQLEGEPLAFAYNVGDCTSLVLRASATGSGRMLVVSSTKPRYHKNGAPYQVAGKGFQSDRPEDGESFAFGVRAGDTVLCFTDGVSGNLKPDEIARIASRDEAKASAAALAKTLVEAARDKCLVDDDTTAVVLRLGEGDAIGDEARLVTTPTELPRTPTSSESPFEAALDWFNQATGANK